MRYARISQTDFKKNNRRPRSNSNLSTQKYKPFEYSENFYRKSFFNYLQGPNENRFVQFNDMPSHCSKYAKNSALTGATTKFSKVISRDKSIVGIPSNEDKFLCANIEYDIEFLNIDYINNKQMKRAQKNKSLKRFDHFEKLNQDAYLLQ